MTKLLAKAFEKASMLPEDLQDALARELMEELKWEAQWDNTLAESATHLDEMAEKALAEHHADRTKKGGFDEL